MVQTPAVYVAYTGQINPAGATPVLTREQVWEGLQIKVEYAQEFVSVITSTEVVSRSEDEHGRQKTVRSVVIKEGNMQDIHVQEEVVMYKPTKVVFHQPDGGRIQNVISTGANGELLMTYDFEWLYHGISEEGLAKEKAKKMMVSRMAVESSISAIREMVKSGRISS